MMSLRSTQSVNYYEGAGVGDSDGISSINPDDIESLSVPTVLRRSALRQPRRQRRSHHLPRKRSGPSDARLLPNTTFSNPFVTHRSRTPTAVSRAISKAGARSSKPSSPVSTPTISSRRVTTRRTPSAWHRVRSAASRSFRPVRSIRAASFPTTIFAL